jgi:hypothetical protein
MKPLFAYTFKSLLIALLAMLCIACDDPYKVGLDLQKNEQLINTYLKEDYEVKTSVVLMDSISNTDKDILASVRTLKGMLGNLSDPQFGDNRATIYSKVLWNGYVIFDSVDIKEPSVPLKKKGIYQSIFLRLRTPLVSNLEAISISRLVHGDTSQALTIKVERLTEALDSNQTYFVNHRHLATSQLLARTTLKPTLKSAKTGATTAYFYQFDIPLSDDLGREIYEKSGLPELATKAAFENMFKGVKISVENPNSAALWNIDFSTNVLSSSVSSMGIVHSLENLVRKDTMVYYLVTPPTKQAQWFTKIETDYSKTQFLKNIKPQEPMPTANTGNRLYIQDGTGLGVHIDFPTLRNLNKTNKDSIIVVNRAELYFEPLNNDALIGNNQPPPSELFLYMAASPTALASGRSTTTDGYSYDFLYPINRDAANNFTSPAFFNYVPTAITYSNGFITRYVQDLIDGKDNGKGMFLIAGFLQTDSQNNSVPKYDLTLSKVIIPDGSPQNGSKRLRLKLHYTKIKKV